MTKILNPEAEKLGYATAKQLGTSREIHTDYGVIQLDDELLAALDTALRPILHRRILKLIAKDQQPVNKFSVGDRVSKERIDFHNHKIHIRKGTVTKIGRKKIHVLFDDSKNPSSWYPFQIRKGEL